MNKFYLYIFILLCFIFAISYYNAYCSSYYANNYNNFTNSGDITNNTNITENFSQKNGGNSDNSKNSISNSTIVLLGDSMLKNNYYVSNDKNVEELLKQQTSANCLNYAQDGAIISDCYAQLDEIPLTVDTSKTFICLSIGGNDILNYYANKNVNNDEYIKSQISVIMDKYKKLVEAIKSRFSYATLILFDIYYPTSEEYKKYYSAIRIWNKMQYKYAKQNNIRMVEVSKLLNKKEDFNNKIEPSEEGGQKIVTAIVRSISTK